MTTDVPTLWRGHFLFVPRSEVNMKSEALELIAALLERKTLADAGIAALRQAFPSAPKAMVETAAFHVFSDGVPAAVEWLAMLERFLREPSRGIEGGATDHLLYHLYNWQQFEASLPTGREGIIELLQDAKLFLAEEDPKSVRRVLDQLQNMFEGALSPPNTERQEGR